MSRVRIGGAGGRRNVKTESYAAATNSSVFRCALKVDGGDGSGTFRR